MNAKQQIIEIQKIVSTEIGVSVEDMLSDKRRWPIAWARQVAIWVCFNVPNTAAGKTGTFSYEFIGKMFRNRDTTTVAHSCRAVSDAIETNKGVSKAINTILEKVTTTLGSRSDAKGTSTAKREA